MSRIDDIMERLFLLLGAAFLISAPGAVLAAYVDDVDMYQASLTMCMGSFSTMLNYALIRIGRVSNDHPDRYGPQCGDE